MTETIPEAKTCTCERPLPTEKAERKGAAITVCLRCGLQIPARLGWR